MSLLKAELHLHTCFSGDSVMKLENLADVCKLKQINCVAITDHNQIEGAFTFRAHYPHIKTIIGEEIMTKNGEIIGYFLSDFIKPYMSAEDTVEAIKIQGGLVCIPHPFGSHGGGALDKKSLLKIIDNVDIIECFNGRNMDMQENYLAEQLAKTYDKVRSVGSDAHTPQEVGRCAVIMDNFTDEQDFLIKLAKAQFIKRQLPIFKNYQYSLLGECKKLAMGLICRRYKRGK